MDTLSGERRENMVQVDHVFGVFTPPSANPGGRTGRPAFGGCSALYVSGGLAQHRALCAGSGAKRGLAPRAVEGRRVTSSGCSGGTLTGGGRRSQAAPVPK